MLGMITVLELLLCARLWAKSCICIISWTPHFTEEEVRLKEAKLFAQSHSKHVAEPRVHPGLTLGSDSDTLLSSS